MNNANNNESMSLPSLGCEVLACEEGPANDNLRRPIPKTGNLENALWDAYFEGVAQAGVMTDSADDRGTSNFDRVQLVCRKSKKVEKAIEDAGLEFFRSKRYGGGFYLICPPCQGQGERRTQVCRAMVAVLRQYGIEARVDYCTDLAYPSPFQGHLDPS